jgi:inhibitor of KinA
MGTPSQFPRYRDVGDQAVLVEFAETIGDSAHAEVTRLDAALQRAPIAGFAESVPAYVSVLVRFDPCATDHHAVRAAIAGLLAQAPPEVRAPVLHEVQVCYEPDLGPDLAAVAKACGLTVDEVIATHLASDYSVYMYGFAPGYAYLAGVPPAIQRPRKATPVRDVPAGSVIIAGPQCLVTTLRMPAGWWIIGRSPTAILRNDEHRPFLFDIGDRVKFRRITRAEFDAAAVGAG